ncbi:hypothetical protein J6590_086332 [Homalodisca vitripennis]|nr:hypothetical protein J6590_086332 [Homalodisca vitripennis]
MFQNYRTCNISHQTSPALACKVRIYTPAVPLLVRWTDASRCRTRQLNKTLLSACRHGATDEISGPRAVNILVHTTSADCSTPISSVPQHHVCHLLSSATAKFSPLATTASTPSSAAAPTNTAVTLTQPATPTPSNVESKLPEGPHPNTPKSTCLAEMQAENSSLRTQVAELRKQLHDVLDHTIESDRRLLQFTDKLFVVNPSRNETPSTSSSVAETYRLNSASNGLPSAKTDIALRNKKNQPIKIQNKYDTLSETPEILKITLLKHLLKKSIVKKHEQNQNKHKHLKKQPKQKTRNTKTSVTPVVFTTAIVEGDSHVRSLAGLVQSLVTADTSVLGVCKPGAGLLGVVEGGQPPLPGTCNVLIASANDVGAGESSITFEHLEQQIIVRTSTAKVVVSTAISPRPLHRPPRQQADYPGQPLHQRVVCQMSVLLGFNTIGRWHFTRHGQHLTMGGGGSSYWLDLSWLI